MAKVKNTTCTVEDCGRKLFSSGLCNTHYEHRRAGKPLGPIGPYGRSGCEIERCEEPHAAKGYCSTHYKRITKSGAPNRDCPVCGAAMDGRKAYCSEACRPACSVEICARLCDGRSEYCKVHRSGIYFYGRLPEYTYAAEKKCVVCGKEHNHPRMRKTCSTRCAQLLSLNGGVAPEVFKQCTRCTTIIDISVPTDGGRKRRSDVQVCGACRRARDTRHRVSVSWLADRDGTGCGICSKPVDMTLLYPDLMRASVDHILPYASGGSHDPENLQLSHLRCNLVKQNRPGFVM